VLLFLHTIEKRDDIAAILLLGVILRNELPLEIILLDDDIT